MKDKMISIDSTSEEQIILLNLPSIQSLPISYYEEALGRLPKDIPVFVFTDDPSWAFGHHSFESDRFFISESDNIHDMCLMSMCNYNIIANSTFSWWGAWAAGHDRVIAPKLWFGS